MKSRKMIELIEKAVSRKKDEIIRQQQIAQRKTDREFLSSYLYDKGEEVLDIAEAQFPIQTRMILGKIVELIKSREIKNRISGRELLALFRSIGVKVRIIQPWTHSMADWRFPVLADIEREIRLPLCDMVDKGDKYELQLEIPGIDKDKIDVKATKNSVEISGEQSEKTEEKKKEYVYNERSYRSFHRKIPIPEDIVPSKIDAKMNNGILQIHLPKKNPTKPEEETTKVEIK